MRFLLVLCWALSLAVAEFRPKTLVIIRDQLTKITHSRFFKGLKKRGHSLEFRMATDKNVNLQMFGERLFDNVIILTPSASKISDGIGSRQILDFVDDGGNVLMVADSTISDTLKKVLDKCGIVVHSKNSAIYDHLSHDEVLSAGADNVVLTNNWIKGSPVIYQPPSAPVLFKGIGMNFKMRSHLNLKILEGSSFAYSGEFKDGDSEPTLLKSSSDLALIGALQTRNNARVTAIGSMEFLSDKFFVSSVKSSYDSKAYDVSGNEQVAAQISEWTFGERGILRAVNGTHYKVDDPANTVNPNRYRLKDRTKFSIVIQEYRLSCDCWMPATLDDIQFEFLRLDPFIRTLLPHDGQGNYELEFTLPDHFGVFKYLIHYQRRGWSNLHWETTVSVRPFRHDEFERFIVGAWPYYSSVLAQLLAFVIFTVAFLFGKDKSRRVW